MNPDTSEIHITGMTCGGCEKSVVNTITSVSGVKTAHADRLLNKAVITWAPGLTPVEKQTALQAICNEVQAAGFDCQL